jgi:uncharacterized membrane protein
VNPETVHAAASGAAVIRLAIFAVMALIAIVLIAWQWHPTPRIGSLALSFVPLLIALPGLIRRERRTFAWACVLTIPYMGAGVTEVIADPTHRAIPATLLLLAFTWLVMLVAYLRVTR